MEQTHKTEAEARQGGDVFDLETSLVHVGGSAEMLADLIDIFFDVFPSMLASLRRAVDAHDAGGIERAAHTLRGSICVFAANRLSSLVATLEDAARHDALEGLEAVYDEIEWETARLRRAFEHFREESRDACARG